MPRRNVKGAASRARILEAAETVFAAKGFYGASVRDLAAAAEMPTASLLHHYSTKTRLYSAILDEIARDLIAALGPVVQVEAEDDPAAYRRAARALAKEYVAWTERHSLRSRILLRELLDIEVRLKEVPRWHLRPVVESLRAFVAAGQARGAFKQLDPLFFIVHLVGSVSYFYVGRPTFERIDGRSVSKLTQAYRAAAVELVDAVLVVPE